VFRDESADSKVGARLRSHDCIDEHVSNFRSGIDTESFRKNGRKIVSDLLCFGRVGRVHGKFPLLRMHLNE
jgi:hypothetical protein